MLDNNLDNNLILTLSEKYKVSLQYIIYKQEWRPSAITINELDKADDLKVGSETIIFDKVTENN